MRASLVASTLVVLAGLALAASTGAQEVRSVFAGADPFALFADGRMWIYPTERGDRLESWSSPDESHWTRQADLLKASDVRWIGADGASRHYLWAPDMLAADGRYYLYYSVGPQDPTPSRLGVATCAGPAGPCVDSGKPLLTGGRQSAGGPFEAIDPMAFVDPRSGRRLLYAGGSAGSRLRLFELAPDMTSIARELPVDQPPLFTEGVFLHERNGIYYLSWSHGRWNTAEYSVHYAMSASPTGPWKYRGAILQSDARYKGPGHHAFVRDPATGEWLIVYHRWEGKHGDGPYTDDRRIAIQPIHYDQDGQIAPVRMSD
ncbi:family 43 glycosylhydrolase [Sphingomonas bacterium]|uniref:family 43 glycosylhydrolase n=1 Tax=Sphingomonas bacterium TaxID=1895847 RepID=UPI0020C5F8F2|nr:family 43 glycosylhydrolase [Sphingomonas bacterium]